MKVLLEPGTYPWRIAKFERLAELEKEEQAVSRMALNGLPGGAPGRKLDAIAKERAELLDALGLGPKSALETLLSRLAGMADLRARLGEIDREIQRAEEFGLGLAGLFVPPGVLKSAKRLRARTLRELTALRRETQDDLRAEERRKDNATPR